MPGRIVKVEGEEAVVDYNGETRAASTKLQPGVKPGDYVIVSAKMVMQVIPEDEAKKILEVWDETDS